MLFTDKQQNTNMNNKLTKVWEVSAHSLIVSLLCCPVELKLRG